MRLYKGNTMPEDMISLYVNVLKYKHRIAINRIDKSGVYLCSDISTDPESRWPYYLPKLKDAGVRIKERHDSIFN